MLVIYLKLELLKTKDEAPGWIIQIDLLTFIHSNSIPMTDRSVIVRQSIKSIHIFLLKKTLLHFLIKLRVGNNQILKIISFYQFLLKKSCWVGKTLQNYYRFKIKYLTKHSSNRPNFNIIRFYYS